MATSNTYGASDVPHVVLTGFMATGKTEVGRRLARRLGWTFVDTDGLVESAAGRTVADVFLEKFGGDSLVEIRRNLDGYLEQVRGF